MKKFLLIFFLISLVFISGCVQQEVQNIIQSSKEKLENLENYKIVYETRNPTYVNNIPYSLTHGKINITKKGNNSKIILEVITNSQKSKNIVYKTSEEAWFCDFSGNCNKIPPSNVNEAPGNEKLLEDWIKRGIISVKYNGINNIINRSCYNVSYEFDLSKLSSSDWIEIFNLRNISLSNESLEELTKTFKSIKSSACFDNETGISLANSNYIEMKTLDSIIVSKNYLRAIYFEPNAVISNEEVLKQ